MLESKEGHKVPDVEFRARHAHEWIDLSSSELFGGKTGAKCEITEVAFNCKMVNGFIFKLTPLPKLPNNKLRLFRNYGILPHISIITEKVDMSLQ